MSLVKSGQPVPCPVIRFDKYGLSIPVQCFVLQVLVSVAENLTDETAQSQTHPRLLSRAQMLAQRSRLSLTGLGIGPLSPITSWPGELYEIVSTVAREIAYDGNDLIRGISPTMGSLLDSVHEIRTNLKGDGDEFAQRIRQLISDLVAPWETFLTSS
uniref:ARAD1D25806p n=1 Tax=Blastobotrys adeninivorans TaxID=409370 RepID=A0A060TFU2_BLAAD